MQLTKTVMNNGTESANPRIDVKPSFRIDVKPSYRIDVKPSFRSHASA